MAQLVREVVSARNLEQLRNVCDTLIKFYGDAPIATVERNGVKIKVIETKLSDGSKVIDYAFE